MAEMTKKKIDEYEEKAKIYGFERLSESEYDIIMSDMENAHNLVNNPNQNDEVARNMALVNDFLNNSNYTAFNDMAQIYKNYCITYFMEKIVTSIRAFENNNFPKSAFYSYINQYLLMPGFQTALELVRAEVLDGKHEGFDKKEADLCGAAVSYMNNRVFEETLAKTPLVVAERNENITQEDVLRNNEKKGVLATNFVLAHLGGVILNQDVTKNNQEKYKGSVGDLFGHGSRTMFVLPKGRNGDDFEDAIFSNVDGRSKVVHYRTSASHEVKIHNGVNGNQYLEEIKTSFSLKHNKGMNIAIGGLGNTFGDGSNWTIREKGKDGHAFFKYESPTNDNVGYIMLGIEGEDVLKTGRNGNVHGPSAKKAPMGPTGATKHVPGAAYGGRVVDLQNFDQNSLIRFINQFKERYVHLQVSAQRKEADSEERLKKVNKCLCGTMMTKEELSHVFGDGGLRMEENLITEVLGAGLSRNGSIDDVVNNREWKLLENQKKEAVLNPKFSFFTDKFEAFKDEVGDDKEAKKVREKLQKVINGSEYKTENRLKEDLKELYKETQRYINVAKLSSKDNNLLLMIKNLDEITKDEIVKKKEDINEIKEDVNEIKEDVNEIKEDINIIKEDDNNEIVENEIVIDYNPEEEMFDSMNKYGKFVDSVKANFLFFKNMSDVCSAAAALTWRDSKAFKTMNGNIVSALDDVYNAIISIKKGRDINVEEFNNRFNGKLEAIKDSAEAYIGTKLDDDLKYANSVAEKGKVNTHSDKEYEFLEKNNNEKVDKNVKVANESRFDFGNATNIKLFVANSVREFARDPEILNDRDFREFTSIDSRELVNPYFDLTAKSKLKIEYSKDRAFEDCCERKAMDDDSFDEIKALYSVRAFGMHKKLNNMGVRIPSFREKVDKEDIGLLESFNGIIPRFSHELHKNKNMENSIGNH